MFDNKFNMYEKLMKKTETSSSNADAKIHGGNDAHINVNADEFRNTASSAVTANTTAPTSNTAMDVEAIASQQAADSSLDVDYSHVLEHPRYIELQQKLTITEQLADKYKNEYLQARADAENFQRRAERDISNAHKYAVEKIAFELLAVVDNLERCLENKVEISQGNAEIGTAINSVYVGVELTLKMFLDVLQKFGVKPLYPLQENFNPDYHTAMQTRAEQNVKPNTVVQVVQKGYMLKDRLLRPALVIVAQ